MIRNHTRTMRLVFVLARPQADPRVHALAQAASSYPRSFTPPIHRRGRMPRRFQVQTVVDREAVASKSALIANAPASIRRSRSLADQSRLAGHGFLSTPK